MIAITTEEELIKCLNDNEEVFKIQGDLKDKVLKLIKSDHSAWKIIMVALIGAVPLVMSGAGIPFALVSLSSVVSILGIGAVTCALTIILKSNGNHELLNKLRDKYTLMEETDQYIYLLRNDLVENSGIRGEPMIKPDIYIK